MTVRVNPQPVRHYDEVPAGIPLTAIGAALLVMVLGLARKAQVVPVPDAVFYGVMILLTLVWFSFFTAAIVLQQPRVRIFLPSPHIYLLFFCVVFTVVGFFGGRP